MARRKALSKRMKSLADVASSFSAWKPAGEVLLRVEAMPTIFPGFDIASRVGGWPLRRVGLVHGPSSHGKTSFALGLGLSFLRANSFFALVDAEYTTPEDWLQKLMAEHATNPGFVAMRPRSYEEVVEGVRELVNNIADARDSGALDKGTSCLVVIDSLRKLVPENLLSKMLKGNEGLDGAKGRGAQMKAALNAQWLDELTPLLYHTNTTLLFIARETENPNAQPWDPKFRVGGGKAVLYDSSMAIRITRAGYVKGSGENPPVYGERHRIHIHKTKVASKEDRGSTGYFHTSNGSLVPEGFDRARDIAELAKDMGLLKQKGSWYTWASTGERWQGMAKVVQGLQANVPTLDLYEQEVRAAATGVAGDG